MNKYYVKNSWGDVVGDFATQTEAEEYIYKNLAGTSPVTVREYLTYSSYDIVDCVTDYTIATLHKRQRVLYVYATENVQMDITYEIILEDCESAEEVMSNLRGGTPLSEYDARVSDETFVETQHQTITGYTEVDNV